MIILKRIFKGLAFLSLLTMALTLIFKPSLPNSDQLSAAVKNNEPRQTDTAEAPFTLKFKDFNYYLTPRAAYNFSGLVVSQHDSNSWFDIYHKNDSVNTKDVCVVWGDNIKTGAYRKVSYKSGEFTCFYRWTRQFESPFKTDYLANNHLIPANAALAKQIKKINISDEVRLEGFLVDYKIINVEGRDIGSRSTSLTRTDSGNGACEVFYVTKVNVIDRHNDFYFFAKTASRYVFSGALFLLLILFFYEAGQGTSHIPPLPPLSGKNLYAN